jgi:hypothetical protein
VAVPRKRAPRAPRTVTRVTVLAAVDSGGGDPDLKAAAEVIKAGAKSLASTWSRTVPESIGIRMAGNTAIVFAGAPAARPAELRLKHPLFGDREHWYGPPGEKFLAPAADAKADAALARYAKKIDRLARAAGYS